MKDKLTKILEFHGGLRNKAQKIVEEAGETAVAIIDYLYWDSFFGNKSIDLLYPDKTKSNLIKEIADIQVVVDQIKIGAGITDEEIRKAKEEKINREINRIKNGFYNKQKGKSNE